MVKEAIYSLVIVQVAFKYTDDIRMIYKAYIRPELE